MNATLELTLRPGSLADASACGDVCFRAFKRIAEAHGYAPDFPSSAIVAGLLGGLLGHAGFHSVVAEEEGRVIGSNFLDERSTIAGVGPLSIDPDAQDRGVGRLLMERVLDRAEARDFAGVRLVQAAYHVRSLALYAKLGFIVRKPLANVQGAAFDFRLPDCTVRRARPEDVDACDRVCRGVHGHDRHGELVDAVAAGTAQVVVRAGRITGYTTQVAFFGHAVAESNRDLMALIGAAPAFAGPGFLVPLDNTELFRWCLEHGLRVVQTMTLMSIGLYNEPEGAYLPSVLY